MTRDELYTFVTSLLDQYQMDEDLFNTLLDIAQSYWEGMRPWVTLRTEDASNTVGINNTFTTPFTFPSDFRSWYTRYPIVLTDTDGNPQQYMLEIPINKKATWKDQLSRFYADYRQKKFFICGKPSVAMVAHLYYKKRGTRISQGTIEEVDGPELLDPNAWTLGANWSSGDGLITHTPGSTEDALQTGFVQAGKTYRIVTSVTGTNGSISIGAGSGSDFEFEVINAGTENEISYHGPFDTTLNLIVRPTTDFDGDVSISVVEVLVPSSDITWDLDPNDEYSKILGLSVAVYHKLGVDYDIINNSQADGNARLALQIFATMTDWDGELQESALQGETYGTSTGGGFGADGMSGHVGDLL